MISKKQLSKELAELKEEVYPKYWPFGGDIKIKSGLKQRIEKLEERVDEQESVLQGLLDYLELEPVEIEAHVEIQECGDE